MSLWAATARQSPPVTPPLQGSAQTDVAVVGAGYTGLAAALALAEAGARVVVLEAESPGFGASGRNGGQVIPGLKLNPDELDRRFGEATTNFAGEAAQTTFALIDRLTLDCGAERSGWIQGTLKRDHVAALQSRAEQWRRRGVAVAWLNAGEMTRRTGAHGFVAGWRDPRGGTLHPLDYARALAKAAQAAGARVHGGTRVAGLSRAGANWTLATAHGEVSAGQVLLAANGYTDGLWPGLEATVLPARSCQIATAPLPADLVARILPGGEAISDTRRIGEYFRLGPGGRLVIGGRGPFREPRAPRDYAGIRAALAARFPDAADAPIEHYWSGRVAMTADHLPHLHEPAPGLIAALGFNGRGVALATALGLAIGAHLANRAHPLPLRAAALRALPWHGLHSIYGEAAIRYQRLRDAWER